MFPRFVLQLDTTLNYCFRTQVLTSDHYMQRIEGIPYNQLENGTLKGQPRKQGLFYFNFQIKCVRKDL